METVFTNHTYNIEIDTLSEITNLWFWGDSHKGCKGHDEDRFNWFLKKAAKDNPDNTYYLGLGDYFDFASTSEQKEMKSGKLHETTMALFDEMVETKTREFAGQIKQMRGKTIGMIEGNHSWTFKNGQTATKDLCERLDTKEIGWLSHITLKILIKSHQKTYFVTIIACHGKAGGKLAGSSINQVEDLKRIFPVADIYVMGHDHQRFAVPQTILMGLSYKNKVYIKQKRQFLCRAGSFLKSYTENASEYVTGRLLKPSDLGALKLEVSFHRDKNGLIKTDIEAII